jgi:archaetidylinositol phosphate synthase
MATTSLTSGSHEARHPSQEATRVLISVLATLERRCLIWLAHRMPTRVNSDHLTGLALASMLGAGGAFWLARVSTAGLWLAVVCLALNWFGDSLDGTLARVRQQQRPRYGFYVDHVVDAVGAAALLLGLGLSTYMSPIVALLLLAAYLMLCVEVFLTTYSLGTFNLSYFKIGPTELRILLSIGTLVLHGHPTATVAGYVLRPFDLGGIMGAIGLLGTFLWSAARHTRLLYELEPIPATPVPNADARRSG